MKEKRTQIGSGLILLLTVTVLAALALLSACGAKDLPSDSELSEPTPHDGVFTSEYGTMTFAGDGESIVLRLRPSWRKRQDFRQASIAAPMCSYSSTGNGAMTRPSGFGL